MTVSTATTWELIPPEAYASSSVDGCAPADSITTLPAGVDGSIRRVEYAYDDQGRVQTISSYDAASGGTLVNQVKNSYDAWGNLVKSQQSHAGAVSDTTPAVQYIYEDGAVAGQAKFLRLSHVIYPNGRTVYSNYETTPSRRLVSQSEGANGVNPIVSYRYLGASTIVAESRPGVAGGLNLTYNADGSYSGWDRFGRTLRQEWRKDDGTLVDGCGYTYDRAGNRMSRTNLLNAAYSEVYSYDALNRLTSTTRNGAAYQNWTLDALGNWESFTSGGTTQTRTNNLANEITDLSGTWVDPAYDAAGNLISGPKAEAETTRLHFVYDGWNRLTQVKADNAGTPGAVIATYQYDGRGFRTKRSLAGGDSFEYYQNESNQVLEVRKNGSANAYEQTVYSQRYIDAPVVVYRDTDTDGLNVQMVHVVQDANFNVTATVDGVSGQVISRFVYSPYGQRTALTATWAAGTTDFTLGHQGLSLDAESGMYYNRARYYHPTLGRFVQRDPLGYVDGMSVYCYLQGAPIRFVDDGGTATRDVQLTLDPVSPVNMPWQAVNWGGPDENGMTHGGQTRHEGSGVRASCALDNGRYYIAGEVIMKQQILLNVDNSPSRARMRGRYGHEQLHVRNGISMAKQAKAKMQQLIDAAGSFPGTEEGRTQAMARATQIKSQITEFLNTAKANDRNHRYAATPRASQLYEPMGGTMPDEDQFP